MQSKTTTTAMLCLGMGALLLLLPDGLAGSLRDVVRAAFVPGQKLANSIGDRTRQTVTSLLSEQLAQQQRELDDLRAELAETKRREKRALLIANHVLRKNAELSPESPSVENVSTQPLFELRAIEARVIGQELLSLWKSKRLLDQGTRAGVQEDQWVLESNGIKLDQGEDASLVPGQMVYASRSVVGRIREAGKLVSSVERLTDRGFRSAATVGRVTHSTGDCSYSSPGLLEGDGSSLCRLTQIPASETVAVGDSVFTVIADQSVDEPLLFGQVVSATPGPLQWEIIVKPEVEAAGLRTVRVLTTSFNLQRLAQSSKERAE